jgi:hypothetical protein
VGTTVDSFNASIKTVNCTSNQPFTEIANVITFLADQLDEGEALLESYLPGPQCSQVQCFGGQRLCRPLSQGSGRLDEIAKGRSRPFQSRTLRSWRFAIKVRAIPAHHPVNRLGKTILALHARSRAPGKPVNGYYFEGFYHAGDTIYTQTIRDSLRGFPVHTACLPIGGKYGVASPDEALKIAEEIGAKRVVPLHYQALVERVPFRYQSSDLVKHARATGTEIEICPLAIGELLEITAKASG